MTDPTAVARARTLSLLLLAASLAAAGPSLLGPGLVTGEPVTAGNVRGTALVVLVVTIPLLLLGIRFARRDSLLGLVLWVAAAAGLAYQAMLFCYGTPMNRLFLAYVAMLGLAAWTLALLAPMVVEAARLLPAGRASRFGAGTLAVISIGNALAWLARAAPITWTGKPPQVLHDSGLITSAVWVQDLALWIPAATVIAVAAWRGSRVGRLLTASMLAFYVVEAFSVASDQWWGARADSSHPAIASMAAVPASVILGLLLLIPLVAQLRALQDPGRARSTRLTGVDAKSVEQGAGVLDVGVAEAAAQADVEVERSLAKP